MKSVAQRVLLITVSLALATSAGAAAQQEDVSEWERQILDQLDRFQEVMLEGGFHAVFGKVLGWLPSAGREGLAVTLRAGTTYGIGGFCDADCSDLDLRLFDDSGRELASDLGPDDYPVLEYTPDRTAEFLLEIEMVTCSSDPCYYGTGVYSDAAPDRDYHLSHTGRLAEDDNELADGEYYDRHFFYADVGQRIVVDMTSSQFDTYLIVRDFWGSETHQNDDYEGSTGHSRLEVVAGAAGTWEIIVTSANAGESGDYRLEIEVGPGTTGRGGLLLAQGHDRVDPRRPARRDDASEHGDQCQKCRH